MPRTLKSSTTIKEPAMSEKLAPIHPGEVLKEDFMVPLGLSASQLAMSLHVPPGRITQIVNGQRAITAETALRLSRYFGTTAELWTNLQTHYELELAKDEFEAQIRDQIKPRPEAVV